VLNPPTPKSAGNTETFQVTGLDEQTTYYFAVRSADERPNWSPISNSPSGTTLGTAKPALSVTVTAGKTELTSEESTEITIEVKKALDNSLMPQASVILSSTSLGLLIEPATGETDSSGLLTASITAPEVSEVTTITIFADVTKLNFKSSRAWTAVTVNPLTFDLKFNLRVTTDDITFSNNAPVEGENVTITAEITNIGNRYSTSCIVKIYADENQVGDNEILVSVDIDETVTVERVWSSVVGEHTIQVVLIPLDPELEEDGTDNTAERSITVASKDGDPSGGGKDKSDLDVGGLSALVYGALIAFIIIVLVIVALFVMLMVKKKKKEEEAVLQAPQATYEMPQAPGYPPIAPGAEAAGMAQPEQTIEQQPIMPEGEQALVAPEEQLQPPADIPAEQQQLPPLATEQPPAEAAAEVPTEHPDAAPPSLPPAEEPPVAPPAEPTQPAEPAAPAAETQQQQQPQQQIACPLCQNMIAPYTTPCPHCNNNLNWS
jgi:hypothetical protein